MVLCKHFCSHWSMQSIILLCISLTIPRYSHLTKYIKPGILAWRRTVFELDEISCTRREGVYFIHVYYLLNWRKPGFSIDGNTFYNPNSLQDIGKTPGPHINRIEASANLVIFGRIVEMKYFWFS